MTTTSTARRLEGIKHIILVLSGKGGVGKSSVACQLALSLHASSPTVKVGILDVDLTGPSIPRMLGVEGQSVYQSSDGWVPVYADGEEGRLGCMSVGLLVKSKGESVVWRGPKKNGMIRQFLGDVRWGCVDYLVVDTPPGKKEAQIKIIYFIYECRNFGRTPVIDRASRRGHEPCVVCYCDDTAGGCADGCAEERVVCACGGSACAGADREHERVRVSVLRGGEPGVLDGGRRGPGAEGGHPVPRSIAGGRRAGGSAGRGSSGRIWEHPKQQVVYCDRGKDNLRDINK